VLLPLYAHLSRPSWIGQPLAYPAVQKSGAAAIRVGTIERVENVPKSDKLVKLTVNFGDHKRSYLEALARYWQISLAATREALADDRPLDEALMLAYEAALSIYFSGDGGPRGCFVIGTAVTEAVEDPEIRNSLAAGLRTIDADFEARLRTARERGELKDDADPAALAVLASATMHTIAIRARAGAPRAELREIARRAVSVICG
jgi:TetR/AcrR family transcriptional regulator, copper-responsive repressor